MISWTDLRPDSALFMTRNYTPGRAGQRVQFLVVHHNAGALTARQIWNLWQTQRTASAHYQVDRDGHISQHVQLWDTAWHSTNVTANQRSIGIEHANGTGVTGLLTPATLDNGAHLVAALCVAYGLGRPQWGTNVRPHSDFVATACPSPIAGPQRVPYMTRAQGYYDQMTGKTPVTDLTKGQHMTITPAQVGQAVADIGYGKEPNRWTWGQAFPDLYNAARYGAPPVMALLTSVAEGQARLEASQTAQDAAIAALVQAVNDLAAAVTNDDDTPQIDVDAVIAAIHDAGTEAAERAADVLRESLDGATATFTLGTAQDPPTDPAEPGPDPTEPDPDTDEPSPAP